MKRLFRSLAAILTVLIISAFGAVAHAAAMPMSGDAMNGMNPGNSLNCSTLCSTAIINKDDSLAVISREDDDGEPVLLPYVQAGSIYTDDKTLRQKLYADTPQPPPKVPPYILHGVLRI